MIYVHLPLSNWLNVNILHQSNFRSQKTVYNAEEL